MKKLLLSGSILLAVAAVVAGATTAFFSDTETSTGNTFTAGDIDLKVDNVSYYNGVASPNTTWVDAVDLTAEKFFNFLDLKPGDYGEDTISLHVGSNDSYVCADVKLTSDDDNSITDPEQSDGDTDPTPGIGTGDLADQVNFLWWADDGDNVLESDETVLPGGPLGALAVGQTAKVTLADAQSSIWGTGPVVGNDTVYIGKAWCFGTIAAAAITQDGETDVMTPAGDNDINLVTGEPTDGGFTCTGASVINNKAQTDSLTADISFSAVQARHNGSFDCTPPPPAPNPAS